MTRTLFAATLLAITLLLPIHPAHAQKGGGGGPVNALIAQPSAMHDFGAIAVGSNSPGQTIRLLNLSPDTVDLDLPSAVGSFAIELGSGSHSLASGQYLDVRVRYYPILEGPEVVEFYPSEDSDLVLSWVGEGTVSPNCGQSLAQLDFGSVDIGSPEPLNVLVSNSSGSAQLIGFFGSCDAFTVSSTTPISVPDGQTGQFTVEFDPQYEGEYVGEFSTGCGSTLWLFGTGVDPMAKGPGDLASPAGTSISMAAAPNPMRESSHIRYAYIGEGTLSAKMRIVDVRGRVLRSESLEITPGSHVWNWDRRDGGGNSVASGVYFLELVAPGTTARQKVTVLR